MIYFVKLTTVDGGEILIRPRKIEAIEQDINGVYTFVYTSGHIFKLSGSLEENLSSIEKQQKEWLAKQEN